ncbi:hypothetical protein SK128_026103 [Halocaridina rubra]|uniref:Ionotropic glutamate receptor L-glutamate and glycine-binding domain-containing protein n=1 Tax=Halocaridina rubra TaxID=373956 RepID=A0AAN8XH42_HALRR
MAVQSLKTALQDNETLQRLLQHPETFRFNTPVSLVIGVKHWPPNMFLTEDTVTGGFTAKGPLANFVEILAMSMNFTYKLIEAPDKAWGAPLPNGTWNGLVGLITREDADIIAATVCRSSARSQVVDYAWPIVVTSGKLLAVRNRPEIDPWSFVMPFAPVVWLAFLLFLLGTLALLLLLEPRPQGLDFRTWALDNFFRFFGACVSQAISIPSGGRSKKSFMVSWICLVAILSWSYRCNLIALLATRHIRTPIQTLRDLLDNPKMTLILEENAIFSSVIEAAKSGILKEVSDLKVNKRLLYLPNKMLPWGVENLVRKGKHALLIDGLGVNKIIADDFSNAGRCDFYMAKEAILPLGCGIIAKKGNPILQAINYRIGLVESNGLYKHWERQFMPNSTTCLNAPSKITVREAFALTSIWVCTK